METISIRELHEKTGRWVRLVSSASYFGLAGINVI